MATGSNEGAGNGARKAAMERKTILRIDRAKSSNMGNPAFDITFADGTRYRTKPNAGWAYTIGNPGLRSGDLVRVRFTRAGRWSVKIAYMTSETES